jgi:hypothetical protein
MYNNNCDLYQTAKSGLPISYSSYDNGDPPFDDRSVIIANLPHQHTLAPPPKNA